MANTVSMLYQFERNGSHFCDFAKGLPLKMADNINIVD